EPLPRIGARHPVAVQVVAVAAGIADPRHVEGGIAIEEARRLEHEADGHHRHHWRVLGAVRTTWCASRGGAIHGPRSAGAWTPSKRPRLFEPVRSSAVFLSVPWCVTTALPWRPIAGARPEARSPRNCLVPRACDGCGGW